MRQALSVLALFAFSSAHAQWIDKQGDEERWLTPSESVNVDSVENVRINEPICAFVVFSGCKPGVAGIESIGRT